MGVLSLVGQQGDGIPELSTPGQWALWDGASGKPHLHPTHKCWGH